MGIDHNEVKRRRKADAQKYSTKQPIAAIEKRVIDSDAFAALPPSAVVVLLLLARNAEKGRNGHIFLSAGNAVIHGINEKTLYRQVKVLIAHGFVCQTTKGGNGQCSKYALTWLPLSKDTKGLHVGHFQPFAWRNWTNDEWKNAPVKMSDAIGQKYRSAPSRVDKKGARVPDKNTDIEVNTNRGTDVGVVLGSGRWIADELERMDSVGLAGAQCFQIPPRVLQ